MLRAARPAPRAAKAAAARRTNTHAAGKESFHPGLSTDTAAIEAWFQSPRWHKTKRTWSA
eukprot:gene28971-34694_t